MNIIAIDPGVHRCACAAYAGGLLVEAWYETAQTFERGEAPAPSRAVCYECGSRGDPPRSDVIVIEQPQFDARTRSAQREVFLLGWHGALLAGSFAGRDQCPIVAAEPREWKGSEPKPQHHARLWEELSATERRVLGGARTGELILSARRAGALARWAKPGAYYYGKNTVHNLLDAAALGAWYAGRLEKR